MAMVLMARLLPLANAHLGCATMPPKPGAADIAWSRTLAGSSQSACRPTRKIVRGTETSEGHLILALTGDEHSLLDERRKKEPVAGLQHQHRQGIAADGHERHDAG